MCLLRLLGPLSISAFLQLRAGSLLYLLHSNESTAFLPEASGKMLGTAHLYCQMTLPATLDTLD